jgi:hypothetical protein
LREIGGRDGICTRPALQARDPNPMKTSKIKGGATRKVAPFGGSSTSGTGTGGRTPMNSPQRMNDQATHNINTGADKVKQNGKAFDGFGDSDKPFGGV